MPRLQIDVTEQALWSIEALMKECGLTKKKDLFNNALTLFKWAVSERKKGNVVASIDERTQKYRELHMPVLDEVRVEHYAATRSSAAE